MPSTYTPLLRVTKPATGEQSGLWGGTVNNEVTTLLEAAIAGATTIAMPDANVTLTAANGAADQSRSMVLQFTGTITAVRQVVVPSAAGLGKLYIVSNETTGGFDLTVKTATGTGTNVPAGKRMLLWAGAAGVVEAVTYNPSAGGGGVVQLPDGTAAAPALNFTNEPTSGIYRNPGGGLAISTGGVGRAVFGSTMLTLGMGLAVQPADALYDAELFIDNNSALAGSYARLRLSKQSGAELDLEASLTELRAGTTNAFPLNFIVDNTTRLSIETGGNFTFSPATTSGPMALVLAGNSTVDQLFAQASDNTSGSTISFRKMRGTIAAPAAVADGDTSFTLRALCYDGATHLNSAQVQAIVSGTPAVGAVPTALRFLTMGTTGGLLERMRIQPDGRVAIGTSTTSVPLRMYAAAPAFGIVQAVESGENTAGTQLMFRTNQTGFLTWAFGFVPSTDALAIYRGRDWTTAGTEMFRFGYGAAGTNAPGFLVGTSTYTYGNGNGRGGIEVNGANTSVVALKTGDVARGYIYADGGGSFYCGAVDATTSLRLVTNNATRLTINTSGNIGVGTTPSGIANQLLHARATGQSTELVLSSQAANNASIRICGNDASIGSSGVQLIHASNNNFGINNLTNGNIQFSTNNTYRGEITAAGVWQTRNGGTGEDNEVGNRRVRLTATTGTTPAAFRSGEGYLATGAVTIDGGTFQAGDVLTVVNNNSTATSISIAQGTSMTLTLAGTTTTGSRTLVQNGVATVLFRTANEAIVMGAGVS